MRRLLPNGPYGAIVTFEIKAARREDVFRFMDRLKLVVRGTSLGDVHSLVLYPVMASHRESFAEAAGADGNSRRRGAVMRGD